MGPDSSWWLLPRLLLNNQMLATTDLGSPFISKGKWRFIFPPRKSTRVCVWQVPLREAGHWACAQGRGIMELPKPKGLHLCRSLELSNGSPGRGSPSLLWALLCSRRHSTAWLTETGLSQLLLHLHGLAHSKAFLQVPKAQLLMAVSWWHQRVNWKAASRESVKTTQVSLSRVTLADGTWMVTGKNLVGWVLYLLIPLKINLRISTTFKNSFTYFELHTMKKI